MMARFNVCCIQPKWLQHRFKTQCLSLDTLSCANAQIYAHIRTDTNTHMHKHTCASTWQYEIVTIIFLFSLAWYCIQSRCKVDGYSLWRIFRRNIFQGVVTKRLTWPYIKKTNVYLGSDTHSEPSSNQCFSNLTFKQLYFWHFKT